MTNDLLLQTMTVTKDRPAFLTRGDGVFREVCAEELQEGTVRSTKEYKGVQRCTRGVQRSTKGYKDIQRSTKEYGGELEVRIVPVECPVGRR
jgi:hypothetical protein